MSFLSDNFIARFFVTVVTMFYGLTGNWMVAMLLFTVAIKLLLLPLDIKQRRSAQQSAAVQGKVKEIQQRYKNDKVMANEKIRELYKKENVKMSAGCLPLLIQMPILFAMFGAINILSNTEMIKLVTGLAHGQNLLPPAALWVHNIWRPDTGTAAVMPSLSEFATILKGSTMGLSDATLTTANQLVANSAINQYALAVAKIQSGTFFGGIAANAMATIPQATLLNAAVNNYSSAIAGVAAQFSGYANGFYIFPGLAGISMYLAQKYQNKNNISASTQDAGQTMKMMEWLMPLMIVWWSASSGVIFALYWTATNLFTLGTTFLINRIMKLNGDKDKKDAKDRKKPA